MTPPRVLEFRSVRGTGGGPEKTILRGAAIATSCHTTVCYLRDARDPVYAIDQRAAALGVDYVEIRERHSFDPAIWPALRRLVRDRRIDLVHSHDYKTNLLALLLSRAEGTLALGTVHGWTGHSFRERWIYYAADKRILARFPFLIAVSEDIRGELVRYGAEPSRVRTLVNGIDEQRFRRHVEQEAAARSALGIEPGAFVIGAVGRLEPQKRFDLLIEAFRTVAASAGHATLLIAGDGGERAALERVAERLGLGARCRFLGHREDVERLHHAFDLLVQASDYEGTPNAVLEAMAFETPIVATDAGGTAQLVEDGVHGVLVPRGSAATLARAIAAVMQDADGARGRARAARQRVETELSFSARVGELERIYGDMMRAREADTDARLSRTA